MSAKKERERGRGRGRGEEEKRKRGREEERKRGREEERGEGESWRGGGGGGRGREGDIRSIFLGRLGNFGRLTYHKEVIHEGGVAGSSPLIRHASFAHEVPRFRLDLSFLEQCK